MNTLNPFVAALIGGVVSSLIYPFVKYFGIRLINTCRLKISIDNNRQDRIYLQVENRANNTLKSLVAFLTINNTESDIIESKKNQGYCTTQIKREMLSWAKNVNGKNKSEIDLNQREVQRLNIILLNENDNSIQVASENGYYVNEDLKCRAVLNGNKDYEINLLITGDNLFHKKFKCYYKSLNKALVIK